jgi:hypothetical protein
MAVQPGREFFPSQENYFLLLLLVLPLSYFARISGYSSRIQGIIRPAPAKLFLGAFWLPALGKLADGVPNRRPLGLDMSPPVARENLPFGFCVCSTGERRQGATEEMLCGPLVRRSPSRHSWRALSEPLSPW